jgi:hypothetical protein
MLYLTVSAAVLAYGGIGYWLFRLGMRQMRQILNDYLRSIDSIPSLGSYLLFPLAVVTRDLPAFSYSLYDERNRDLFFTMTVVYWPLKVAWNAPCALFCLPWHIKMRRAENRRRP